MRRHEEVFAKLGNKKVSHLNPRTKALVLEVNVGSHGKGRKPGIKNF